MTNKIVLGKRLEVEHKMLEKKKSEIDRLKKAWGGPFVPIAPAPEKGKGQGSKDEPKPTKQTGKPFDYEEYFLS